MKKNVAVEGRVVGVAIEIVTEQNTSYLCNIQDDRHYYIREGHSSVGAFFFKHDSHHL
jgi:hypothetical protein